MAATRHVGNVRHEGIDRATLGDKAMAIVR
jgi:hypothetical protein